MSTSRFARLIDLAQATDSNRRRELLRDVTDLFFETSGQRSPRESALFDDVLKLVAKEMQDEVLAQLAETFADAEDAPAGLMTDLANHAFQVAEPVLRRSKALDEQTLLAIVQKQGQHHITAVAQRGTVSESVSEAIVRRGDDFALDALMRNAGARISRKSMETAVNRARENAFLHEGVVQRGDLPLDLLNEMYFVVESSLRNQILERNASVPAEVLDAALAKARSRLSQSASGLDAESKHAAAFIAAKKKAGELDGRLLIALHRESKRLHFLHGLAEMTGLDHQTVADLLDRRDVDGLAMVCRAADVERALFVSLALLACGGDEAMSMAEEYGRMYNSVPVEAAQRAMRFFKVRKSAATGSYAA